MVQLTAQIHRDPAGYAWRELETSKTRVMTGNLQLWGNSDRRTPNARGFIPRREVKTDLYDPFLEEPALFRIFARVEPIQNSILDFANKYGDIATRHAVNSMGGSLIEEWDLASQEIRSAVQKADAFIAKRRDEKARAKDTQGATSLVNEILGRTPVRLGARGRTDEGVNLQVVVECLHDVMKLQLAMAVIEEKRYRDCDFCGKPFELTPQINRADKLFCSDNCRVKTYQRKKKRAIAMREQGQSLRSIVGETGSDLETVKGWVAAVNSKEK